MTAAKWVTIFSLSISALAFGAYTVLKAFGPYGIFATVLGLLFLGAVSLLAKDRYYEGAKDALEAREKQKASAQYLER